MKCSASQAVLIAGLLTVWTAVSPAAIRVETVPVGNPDNKADTTGVPSLCGAVAHNYNIGKYEVTNSQYASFLNAVDAGGTNPHGLYKAKMGSNAHGGISFDAAAASGAKYSARTNMANKPVNFVSWYSTLRFANWLHNGQPSDGGGTEDGAYDMSLGIGIHRKKEAKWWLPSEDEWYKAAYHDKKAGKAGAYFDYPTGTNDVPTAVTASATGNGSAGGKGNHANFAQGADWNGQDGNVTTVGTSGGPSPYGTFDQGGNVWEWSETFRGSSPSVRGVSFSGGADHLGAAHRIDHGAAKFEQDIGFRVASRAKSASLARASDLVPVGHRKQLLVDDYVIAHSAKVVRELGKVTKLNNGKPVFDGLRCDTVLYDEGKFKLWYRENSAPGYAESKDGVHFRKIAKLDGLPGGAHFTIDPHETDAAHRYKACHPSGKKGRNNMAAALSYSADGIHWKPYNNGNPVTHRAADTNNQIVWDEDAKVYRLFTRTDYPGHPIEVRGTRSMTNPDIKAHPTAWRLVRNWKFDREGPDEWKRRQVYALTDWIYHGVHFGLIMVYEWPTDVSEGPADYRKRHDRDQCEFYIATSRDADSWDLTWVYAGKPMVPRGPEGAWDKGMLLPPSEIVTHADRHWLYYTAWNERHNMPKTSMGIGVATLRLDGFVSLEAKDEPGTVVTKPFKLAGDKLQVNVAGGEFQVEVLNKNGDPLPGFSAKESTKYKDVDELRLTPTWKNSLSTLEGSVVRLRFHLRNGRLFSFQILE
ncbi:MAG: SUMF1/EgtB/PvdO family nonheme iron enzyme [Planctomycetota bacterium]|nr:SUMF1/EgtB/PvdO family nonheme iron enzyme [Planctomycetota bacterium]